MRIMILLVLIGVAGATEIMVPTIPRYLVNSYGVYLTGSETITEKIYDCATDHGDLQIEEQAVTYKNKRHHIKSVMVIYDVDNEDILRVTVIADSELYRWVLVPESNGRLFFNLWDKAGQKSKHIGEGAPAMVLVHMSQVGALKLYVDGRVHMHGKKDLPLAAD